MSKITKETRKLSYEDILTKANSKYFQVLTVLKNNKMTAKEVAVEMFNRNFSKSNERNVAAPRLNELVELNIVHVVDKKRCQYTGKTVAVYEIVHS